MDRFPGFKEILNLDHNMGVYHKDCFVHKPVTMSVGLMLRAVGLSPGGRWRGPFLAHVYTRGEIDEDGYEMEGKCRPLDLTPLLLGR
jgi:hypothetical protein